ncbi:MAG: hypothetical protein P1V51_08135 [Deltaproteobacteria bacterium]|nr:hypothetical protein [Deltaproteobacteria bacterium]
MTELPPIGLWAQAFALTLLIEVPIYAGLAPEGCGRARAALAGAAGSALTHPLLWYVWVPLIPGYGRAVMSGEVLVVVLEILVFHLLTGRRSLRRAAAAALLANAASYGLGLVWQALR